jgi:hypothetical protein
MRNLTMTFATCLLFASCPYRHVVAFQLQITAGMYSIQRNVECKLYATPDLHACDDTESVSKDESTTSLLTSEQKEFLDSLDTQMYGKAFIERLRDLQEYKNKYGTCHVPKRYAGNPTLGNWVNKSRQMYRKHQDGEKSSMTPERIEVLNQIGFMWLGTSGGADGLQLPPMSPQQNRDRIWEKNYQQLKEYIDENGSLISLSGSTKLGVWAARQRREYQKLKLGEKANITQERVDKLNSIGFDWSPWDTKWQMRVNQLLEYKREHGDCLVPVQYPTNRQLGRWVSTQRKYRKLFNEGKATRITEKRIKQLTSIGFVWNRWEQKWNNSFDD